jgi:hypothetical protein
LVGASENDPQIEKRAMAQFRSLEGGNKELSSAASSLSLVYSCLPRSCLPAIAAARVPAESVCGVIAFVIQQTAFEIEGQHELREFSIFWVITFRVVRQAFCIRVRR